MHRSALLCLLVAAAPVLASAPDAWDQHYRQVVASCLKASKLERPRSEGHLMLFSDEVGTALLIRGKQGKKKDELKLCIFRRGSGQVEIQSVDDGVDPASYRK